MIGFDFITVDNAMAVLSIAIGVIIFLMQTRADSEIDNIIKKQFRRQEPR
jgi:hypothetical protein